MTVQKCSNKSIHKALCILFVILFIPFAKKKDDHPVFKTVVPSEWQSEPVVILSDTVRLELKKSGKNNILIEKDITWYKINNSSSGDLRTFHVWYYNYLERKPLVKVQAFYKGNKRKNIYDIVHKDSLIDKWSLYGHKEGYGYLEVSVPDYSNIAYLRVEEKHQIKRVEEYGYYPVRHYAYNTVQKNIILTWPPVYTLNYGLENEEGLPIKVKTGSSGKNSFSIEAKNIKEREQEDKHKFPELWYAALFVSFPPRGNKSYTWEEAGRHYFEIIYDSLAGKDTSILDSIVGVIPGGTREEIIKNTYNFVKENIRYYGSWESSYGWIPRGPKEILAKGYGDCKEMANVLAMLLRKRGINASLTLLRRNKDYNFKVIKKYPTLSLSDHVITCAELQNGYKLYLDPTTKSASYKTSYYEYLNQNVLVFNKTGSFIDTVKRGPDYQNKIITNSTVKQDNTIDHAWLIEGDIVLYGDVANNLYMKLKRPQNDSKTEVTKDFLEYRLKFRPTKVKLTGIGQTAITIHYTAKFRDNVLTSPKKGLILSTPSLYTPYSSYSDLSIDGDRYLCTYEQVDTWKIPKGFRKFNLSILNSTYGKGRWSHSGNTVTREYNCNTHFIKAANRKKVEAFFKERRNFSHGIVWSQK